MVSWSTIQPFLILLGPIIYSRGKAFYQSTKLRGPPRVLTPGTHRILNILFATGVVALLSTLPAFAPENIFQKTGSRLQIPTDVLFNRLSKIRDITPDDEILRARLVPKEARLAYATFGPKPLVECSWCSLEEANTYLFYALPTLALPHLLHIAVLGVVTSSYFSPFGSVWRTQATVAGLALFLAELCVVGVSTSDHNANALAKLPADVVWTHWRLILWRGIGIAFVDAWLGYVIFLTGTGRWTAGLDGLRVQEKLETLNKASELVYAKLHSENLLRQTVLRNKDLREKSFELWMAEEKVGKEIMLDEEVKNVRANLTLDVTQLTKGAAQKSEGMLNTISTWRGLPAQVPPTSFPQPSTTAS
ncbi:unnamed protein product [Tuber melanosporum]|uniref:(Perigord truffle) hypothetical protein n=1 Tax=Tuber melanosporum (strain Mel28) TaxID=656061 RepID=D5GH64_TUBMM|nr:uncharacterized protein GSTUM_00007766001 [Tuber melanosporum]CAZ83889.1 unnamed protein product [Tuber melanosporum]